MFAVRLKKLRLEKSLTQKQLGEIVGVIKQAVNNWEKGIASPNLYTFKMLCDYFNVSADYLLGRTDKPEINNTIGINNE